MESYPLPRPLAIFGRSRKAMARGRASASGAHIGACLSGNVGLWPTQVASVVTYLGLPHCLCDTV